MAEKSEFDYTCGIFDEELIERFKESIWIDNVYMAAYVGRFCGVSGHIHNGS